VAGSAGWLGRGRQVEVPMAGEAAIRLLRPARDKRRPRGNVRAHVHTETVERRGFGAPGRGQVQESGHCGLLWFDDGFEPGRPAAAVQRRWRCSVRSHGLPGSWVSAPVVAGDERRLSYSDGWLLDRGFMWSSVGCTARVTGHPGNGSVGQGQVVLRAGAIKPLFGDVVRRADFDMICCAVGELGLGQLFAASILE
jgi:hypothetical protein